MPSLNDLSPWAALYYSACLMLGLVVAAGISRIIERWRRRG